MNDITPKEANEILTHYTDLGYGIVIEGDDTTKIKQALDLASKSLTNGTPYNQSDECEKCSFKHTEKCDICINRIRNMRKAPDSSQGDYVSRMALKKELLNPSDNIYLSYGILEVVFRSIDNAPAIEITEEQAINKLHETGWLIEHDKEMTTRPQGQWINKNPLNRYAECSECRYWNNISRYCPECGADMRGGAE